MHRMSALVLGVLALLACAACGGDGKAPPQTSNVAPAQNSGEPGQQKSPPADIVRAEAQGVELAAGGSSAEASVRLSIAPGYHITANPATLSYQIATQLNVEPSEGITAAKPVYPSSVMQKFAFEPQPFAVYEAEAVIKLPVSAEARAAKGSHALRARLRVQACDDQACYMPKTLNISIPVTVK